MRKEKCNKGIGSTCVALKKVVMVKMTKVVKQKVKVKRDSRVERCCMTILCLH